MIETISPEVIGCAIRVHRELGPGFVEKIYQRAMILDLRANNIPFQLEKSFAIYYQGVKVGHHVLDLVVNNELLVELKVATGLGHLHYQQVRSSLKASGLQTGLLINFATERADIRRVDLRSPLPTHSQYSPKESVPGR